MADKNLYDSPTTKHIKLVSLKEDYSFKSAGNADYILEFFIRCKIRLNH